MERVIGGVLFLVGAVAAAGLVPALQRHGRGRYIPLALIPAGAAIGAGAALVRGWNVVGTALVGGVVVPLFAIVQRLIETRRAGSGARRGES